MLNSVGKTLTRFQEFLWQVGMTYTCVCGIRHSEQDSHQALQNSLRDIEFPGSRATHVVLKCQVSDGEVDSKMHQDRGCCCREGGGKTHTNTIVFLWTWTWSIICVVLHRGESSSRKHMFSWKADPTPASNKLQRMGMCDWLHHEAERKYICLPSWQNLYRFLPFLKFL